jgi:hypothetical protein
MERPPGPLCQVLRALEIDSGTLCRYPSKPPGSVGARRALITPATIASKKNEYLGHARKVSYAMQGKSVLDGGIKWAADLLKKTGIEDKKSKSRRVQSFLGGAFLRMYLDGKTDPDVIAKAGEEIAASEEFAALRAEVAKHLTAVARRGDSSKDIAREADSYLKRVKNKRGIAFRRTLNAVIGGVTNIEVGSAMRLENVGATKSAVSAYRLQVTFYDTYDFENKRSGEYDHYRKKLARLLLANEFDKFWDAYVREVEPQFMGSHHTSLDNAAVFASYMYALEKKGWTPGPLAWHVTVPMEVSVVTERARRKH